jgi:hypothetical protein
MSHGNQTPVASDSSSAPFTLSYLNNRRRSCIDSKALILLCLLAAGSAQLSAQDPSNEFWPQLNASWRLSPDFQLVTGVAEHAATDPKDDDFRIGATLIYHLPFKFTGPLARHHPEESRYLSVNGGYTYIPPAPDGTAPVENRGVFQFVGRVPWPRSILTTDRNEMDLRWISGSLYWRYRNRVSLQRTFHVHSHEITPVIYGELQYYSKYDSWYRNDYGAGLRFTVAKLVEIFPYYERENTSHSTPAHVNAVGVAVTFFFRD